MTTKMIAPAGNQVNTILGQSGTVYNVASDGSVSGVLPTDVSKLLDNGFTFFITNVRRVSISSPLPADLISIKAAATPANGAITIAAQPPQPRKMQVRIVLGTPGTTNITAGTLTLLGTDQDGNAITEVVQLNQFAALSGTYLTLNAYATLTSGTVAAYAASGSGTGNTLGIGLSNDFGVPTRPGAVDFAIIKASKITKVLGTSNIVADDLASTATIDTVARTINPTTAPAANGLVDYEFSYSFS